MEESSERSQNTFQVLQNGPIPNYRRQTNDLGCVIFYGIVFLIAVAALTTACIAGNLDKLSRTIGQGYRCGKPSQRSQTYKYAYFYNPPDENLTTSQAVCVKKCPTEEDKSLEYFNNFEDTSQTIQSTETVLDRFCLPDKQTLDKFRTINSTIDENLHRILHQQTFFNFFLDFLNFYPHFAVCLGIITFVSIIMRVIFHVIDKKCILWSGFIVFFGGTICLAIILLSKGGFLSKQNYEGYLKLELPSEPDYQVKAYQGIAYFFITLAVFQFLLLIYRILKRPRGYLFKLSVPGERQGQKVYPENPHVEEEDKIAEQNCCFDGTFQVSLISTLLLIIIWAATLIISVYLGSGSEFENSSDFPIKQSDSLFQQPKKIEQQKNRHVLILGYGIFIWGLWTQLIIVVFAKVLIAYKLSINHFQGIRRLRGSQGTLRIVLSYHLGSIMMGALFCLFLGPLYYLFWTFCEGPKKVQKGEIPQQHSCFYRFWNCLNKAFSCANEGAYPFLAMYGGRFVECSRLSYQLFWQAEKQVKREEVRVRKLTVNLWRWGIMTFTCGIITLVFHQQWYMRSPIYLVILIFIIGMGIIQLWTMSYELKAEVDAICRCLQPKQRTERIIEMKQQE